MRHQEKGIETSRTCVAFLLGLPLFLRSSASAAAGAKNPRDLRTDSLTHPLGIDSARPLLSWRLQDDTPGAKQTAYEILVYSKWPTAIETKPDVWDSGRVASSTSTGMTYGGPELEPEKRYFWRVTLWDRDGKPYPISEITWWETGLLSQSNWQGKWIGYEDPALHRIRESGAMWITNFASQPSEGNATQHDFRYSFSLDRPVQSAALYATGADTTAAWINGRQVLQAQALTPWQQVPWETYTRVDVTASVRSGANLLAIGVTRFPTWERWNGDQMRSDPSMISYNDYAYGAVGEWLYRYAAGVDTVSTGPGFRTIYLHPNFDARMGSLTLDDESPYGAIHSEWNVEGNQATWKVTVPPNATALLSPRATNAESISFKGAPVESSELRSDSLGRLELPAGSYTFIARLRKPASESNGSQD